LSNDIIEIETKISDVVIYRDGAKITRIGNTSLKKGTNTIKIGNISKFCDKDSVRISGIGAGTLIDINVDKKFQEITGFEILDKLIEQKKELERKIELKKEELQFNIDRKNDINQLFKNFVNEFPKWFSSGESEIRRLEDMNKITIDKNNELSKEIDKIKVELQDLNKKLEVINAEISKIDRSTQKVQEYYDVIINLESEKDQEFDIHLTYQVKNAYWEPIYDVNIGDSSTIIKYMASIVNNTFEDWENVNLEVSTAIFQSVEIIEPQPWYLDIFRPAPPPAPPKQVYRKRAHAPKLMAKSQKYEEEELMADQMAEVFEKEKIPEIQEIQASFTENLAGIQIFKYPTTVNIPSDGNPHPIVLSKLELDSRTEYYWSSTNPVGVIARSIIKNGDQVLLPSKKVKVFYNKDFIGETGIDTISPNEEFKLGTRLTYDLKVEKKLIDRKSEKTLIRGKKVREYQYLIKIENFTDKEKKITIVDRIPFSKTEAIKINIKEIDPEPKKNELNILTWDINLEPKKDSKSKSEFNINYRFSVEYDKDIQIYPPLP